MNQEETIPEIDYLSKDYASFRRLMLDHLALSVPGWSETSEADVGNVLVEILAYSADYLSYYQDAVATEAYLGTARLRSSVKRHVRLLDYLMLEGCNARTWVQVQVSEALVLPQATQVFTHVSNMVETPTIPPHSPIYDDILRQQPTLFATLYSATLYPEQNEIALYVEEGEELSLPVGCTTALLRDPGGPNGPGLHLKVGDVLAFEEVKNVTTGTEAGADASRRHAARLTAIQHERAGGEPVLRVIWAREDALPYPLRVATRQQGELISDICVARGNMVLADHGMTIYHEVLPPILSSSRYRPSLQSPSLTYAVPYDHALAQTLPACAATSQDILQALPVVSLFQQSRTTQHVPRSAELDLALHQLILSNSDKAHRQLRDQGIVLSPRVTVRHVRGSGWELHDTLKHRHWLVVPGEQHLRFVSFTAWTLRRDLLSSGPLATDYSVDIEEDRRASLRFGLRGQGMQPQAGDQFQVTYRVGSGVVGNVRADALTHIVTDDLRVLGVHNPLTAEGGTDPQELEEVRLNAPYAFHTPLHCVTTDDYATVALRYPQVTGAVARQRRVGSRSVVCIHIQRANNQPVDAVFAASFARFMQDFRVIGHEIEVREPYFVALSLTLRAYLHRSTVRSITSKALAQTFGTGEAGFFRAGRFTFGQRVYQSQIIAWAMRVPGVTRTEVEIFHRLDAPDPPCVDAVQIQPLEIARLNNDPTAPYNGRLHIVLEGGL